MWPLLVLIYINDLPFSLKNSEVTIYTDDTSIKYSSKNIDELSEALNSDIDSLKQWLEGNKLSLNVIKTRSIVIGSRSNIKKMSDKSIPTPSLPVGDLHVDVVDHAKYLGVHKHHVWDEHAKVSRSKITCSLSLSRSMLRNCYQSLLSVRCIEVSLSPTFATVGLGWDGCGDARLLMLQKLQNRPIRLEQQTHSKLERAQMTDNQRHDQTRDGCRCFQIDRAHLPLCSIHEKLGNRKFERL